MLETWWFVCAVCPRLVGLTALHWFFILESFLGMMSLHAKQRVQVKLFDFCSSIQANRTINLLCDCDRQWNGYSHNSSTWQKGTFPSARLTLLGWICWRMLLVQWCLQVKGTTKKGRQLGQECCPCQWPGWWQSPVESFNTECSSLIKCNHPLNYYSGLSSGPSLSHHHQLYFGVSIRIGQRTLCPCVLYVSYWPVLEQAC